MKANIIISCCVIILAGFAGAADAEDIGAAESTGIAIDEWAEADHATARVVVVINSTSGWHYVATYGWPWKENVELSEFDRERGGVLITFVPDGVVVVGGMIGMLIPDRFSEVDHVIIFKLHEGVNFIL